ncbi:sigma-70 family RNA polymerase sigma factor [Enhygromyxa salina]|uniref:ECF RNA polymerase sigma factor SigJ n=1 Tax=Enhygromyxa salina TaxID=215803 RepID=A0A2S9YNV3_9BACT|nr:sigma-70 family RNA polymerase sigma factor [Enhygromyxa salina]PRQ06764.1 ECF RNA polymerase sigma factor SigJ [Enhygromyxa salina]
MDPSIPSIPWPALFAEHQRYLWSVCYRMTGDAQDAEDLVQATFERAMQRPPEQLDRPWRPWLTRVATNLSIDLLRRRSHQAYDGPWLPAPVEELLEVEGWTCDRHGGDISEFEVRYGQLESARLAFLLALETLDPRGRAVLILRDVLGYSGPEIGEFLGLTGANVRVILHRARKALDEARGQTDDQPRAPDHADASVHAAIERLMTAIRSGDPAALSELLAEDVRICTDAGGEFLAARKVVSGRDSVAKLLLGIAKLPPTWTEFRQINGEPGLVMELAPTPLRTARRAVLHLELAGSQIKQLQLHLASRKLVGIDFTTRAASRP